MVVEHRTEEMGYIGYYLTPKIEEDEAAPEAISRPEPPSIQQKQNLNQ